MVVEVAIILVASGVAVLWLGLRGRWLNDHPWCRRCRFDLFGTPDASSCPECGADLRRHRAVRVGQRRKRKGLAAAGAVMLLLGGATIGLAVFAQARGVDWIKYKPVWWLRLEANGTPGQASDAALGELSARLAAKDLSAGQVGTLMQDALAAQGDAKRTWQPAWGDLIETACAQGQVSDADWKRYAEQAMIGVLEPEFRPKVRRGDPVPYRVYRRGARVGEKSTLAVKIDAESIRVGSIRFSAGGGMGGRLSPHDSGSTSSSVNVTDEQWAQIPDGKQAVQISFALTLGGKSTRVGVFKKSMTVSDAFEVVPADEPTARTVVDERQRDALAKAVTIKELTLLAGRSGRRPYLSCNLDLDHPPVDLAFALTLRAGETELKAGSISLAAGKTTMWSVGAAPPGGFDAQVADVILTPSLDAAVRSIDTFDIWGEPMVFKNVPIKRR